MKKYTIKNGSARSIMVGGGPESIIKPGKSAVRELDEAATARLATVKGIDVSAYKEPAPKDPVPTPPKK